MISEEEHKERKKPRTLQQLEYETRIQLMESIMGDLNKPKWQGKIEAIAMAMFSVFIAVAMTLATLVVITEIIKLF